MVTIKVTINIFINSHTVLLSPVILIKKCGTLSIDSTLRTQACKFYRHCFSNSLFFNDKSYNLIIISSKNRKKWLHRTGISLERDAISKLEGWILKNHFGHLRALSAENLQPRVLN